MPADLQCTRYQIPKCGHSACKHGGCLQACQPLPTETHRNKDIPCHQKHIQHAKQWSQQTHIPRHCIMHFVYVDNRQHASNPPQPPSHHTPPRPNHHTQKNRARMDRQTPSQKQQLVTESIYTYASPTTSAMPSQDEGWSRQAMEGQTLHRKPGQAQ